MAATGSRSSISWLPVAWVIVVLAVLAAAFFSISWAYVDVHNNLRAADGWSWPQALRYAFGGGVEYRPLPVLALKGGYDLFGLHLWAYQAIVLVQFGAILALLVWMSRPIGAGRTVAVIIALSCIVGLHTSRALFLLLPVNPHSAALLLVLAGMALALDPRTRAVQWIFLPLTLLALFTIELGLLLVPLVLVLWWREAPGLGPRGMAWTMAGLAVYLGIRFSLGVPGALGSVYTGSGLGFSQATPETLRNVFEHAPWMFWIYNVAASFLSVVASEPRAGVYEFTAALLSGGAPFWKWLHVLSSLVTTGVVIGVLASHRPLGERDRLLCAAGFVLIVLGSGLGFLYTRDRIGLPAGVGYGLLVFVALAAMIERLPASGWKRVSLAGLVGVLALAWTVRTAEAYVHLRDTAWDYHLEWTDRYAELGGPAQPQTTLLTSLREAALRSTPDDPRLDPAWTYVWFERRFRPGGGSARVSADDAADSAVAPLSLPFDIRWKPEVDEAARARLEAELGLAEGEPVTRDPRGRTWQYRLRTPTRERVQAIVLHDAVEDTARIDARRLEIVN